MAWEENKVENFNTLTCPGVNALKELHDLRASMEDNGDWDGTYSDFINAAGGNLKSLIYKYNEKTGEYDGDPNPWKEDYDDDD